MATIAIDELNNPKEFDSEEYIKNYFKPMRISEDRKEEREDAARDFRDVLLFILALIAVANDYNALNWAYIEEQFRRELEKAALRYARSTQALQDYIAEKASNFIGVTRRHDLTDSYWTSDERATHEAVDESNSVVSLSEWQRAKELGAEKKRWRTERDNRVRYTHMRVDGKSVAIDRMFEVGDALMRFPGDFFHSVRESVNCRCCLEYIDGNGNVVMVGKHGTNNEVNKTDEKVQYTKQSRDDIIEVGDTPLEAQTIQETVDKRGETANSEEKMTQREREYYMYSDSWSVASLNEALSIYAPNAIALLLPKKRKLLYKGDKFTVVYDYVFDYFRIENPLIRGKRRYVLMDGTNPTNITKNGRTWGRSGNEYEMMTHFKNGD